MKTIRTALALMLSAACFTGCDSNADIDVEALQADLDDEDIDSLVAAEEAQSDDEDGESAPSFETEMDLVDNSSPALAQTCSQWTPTPALCSKADILCLDYDETPYWCTVLTQCLKCNVEWGGLG
ncbi:hypothetical protein [Nannocystis punicea]|uniref:Lipoprotein n=1 Tax=Nannocystis punicea TaxID=2995304 RepID=A0ABY7GSW7_9BACT|nr:hypothetical protein [Nannocystis poenicansa]WAS90040.1 hypothetical protein O0S08_27925 [Nannocystis poenicansa]